ncbi:MAG: hypothetical protein GXP31_00665 [Kiritimatiellaeota bacterium]|nr:hypothetical protein [Kiritimatiellota bacterium]
MLNRSRLRLYPLAERKNKVDIERAAVPARAAPRPLSPTATEIVEETVERVRRARRDDKPVVLAFGAHTIKNGLGPVLIELIERGWVTHLATNGAGIIHDWEFAFLGKSSEDVRTNVAEGRFGLWEETGFHLNLALVLGARDGLGYGEAVGRLIAQEAHHIPGEDELLADIHHAADSADAADRAAAAADLLGVLRRFDLAPGTLSVAHPWSRYSVQAAAHRLGVPFTGHPMIGHDIIYVHPLNHCAAIGRVAQRDFLVYAAQIARLDGGGVYLSVGSAVMSPMIFEKSMAMARNLALRDGRTFEGHFMAVVDLAPSRWDWRRGEPPEDSPDYYLRYCKTFSRMGGTMRYATADNRDFLLALCRGLG